MVQQTRKRTAGLFGVDLICADLPQGPATTDEHIDRCMELGVRLVTFHHDLPPSRWVDSLRGAGARVWMQASSLQIATHAAQLGVDGIVVQGREAGGHNRSTVALVDLLRQARRIYPDMLLLAAGGITTGRAVADALLTGADGVWVGTRLVASDEAHAHDNYKRRLVESNGDTCVTTAFGPEWPDQPYRLLATDLVRAWAGRERDLPTPPPGPSIIGKTRVFRHSFNTEYAMPKFSAFPPTPETEGEWDEMAFPAGTGTGSIERIQPVRQIVIEMMNEAQVLLRPQSPSLAPSATVRLGGGRSGPGWSLMSRDVLADSRRVAERPCTNSG
jgi:enoyl-[acyl-carrier protein] reductase II